MPVPWPVLKFLFKMVAPSIPEVVSTITGLKQRNQETHAQHHNTQARFEEIERNLATQLDLIDQLTSQITTFQKIVRKTLLLAVLAIGLGLIALGLVIFE